MIDPSNIRTGVTLDGITYEITEMRGIGGVRITSPSGKSEWMAHADVADAASILFNRWLAGKRVLKETAV